MKHIITSAAALALAAGLATSAHAEPFNGPYTGVQAGWNQDDPGRPSTPFGDVTVNETQDSFSAGVFAGYDHKIGSNVVIGAEAGLQLAADDTITGTAGPARISIEPKRSIDLTARAGYLVSDNTLLYARGGYTNARMETTLTDTTGTRSRSENRDGWLVGGGVERAINDDLSARLEYRYSDLSEGDDRFDRHQALVGVAYRF